MNQYHDMNDNINISDVIEVIENTDPGFVEGTVRCQDNKQVLNMMSGGGIEVIKSIPPIGASRVGPYVEIIEQPASKALRFRYECEGRSAGSIPGVNSTPENKTFPSIKVVGYKGRAVVVVSCVTKDPPYRPHPHNLVGKEACRRGVCTVEISSENMTMTFAGLGIQCVKKKDIEEALRVREEIRVDPFRTGFEHKRQPASIDLNAVRMCFQVFIEGSEKGKFTVPLPSIVSDPIYDKKAMSDLVICKLSHCSASAAGGMEMMLLCEKVAKEDIQVRFFEERDGQVVWEGLGDFQPSHVHKQVAIAFRTPAYCNQHIDQPVQLYIQLMRPSDHATSDPLPFQMVPLGAGRPAFWFMRKALTKKKADPDILNKIIATNASIMTNEKISRNLISDELNNNDVDIAISQGKISALRTLNDIYNIKNYNNQSQNDSGKFKLNDRETNNNIEKSVIDIRNLEVTLEAESQIFNGKFDNSNTMDDVKTIKTENQDENIQETQHYLSKNKNEWFDYPNINKWVETSQPCLDGNNMTNVESKNENEIETSFDELINQVEELDQIYADTHTKILQANSEQDPNKTFNEVDVYDNQTYTSLQMAMKNPIKLLNMKEERKYEDVAIINEEIMYAPFIQTPPPLTAKRDMTRTYEEKLPPLPPKRIRKMPSMPVLPHQSSLFHNTIGGNNVVEAPHKHLPSVPRTLPIKPAKQNLFAKLFAKKHKKDNNLSIEIMRKSSITSLKDGLRDVSPISSRLPLSSGVEPIESSDVVINNDDTPPYGIELTEAEHYALYTAMAPHATTSEFDELSFYYSPVEGGKILTDTNE
ncbi:hypothetical protein PV326_012625 [Microctonus aethiopoides]|nr:hypothetical protein PV326_012625 [Microctonus aethiopoides]